MYTLGHMVRLHLTFPQWLHHFLQQQIRPSYPLLSGPRLLLALCFIPGALVVGVELAPQRGADLDFLSDVELLFLD